MQKPVRYYIVKADDQPVVRSVPVTVPPVAPSRGEERLIGVHAAGASSGEAFADARVSDGPFGADNAVAGGADRRKRLRPDESVARLMRAAIRRNHRHR